MSSIKPGRGGYPAEWEAIRALVIKRAGYRCLCHGHCGERHRVPIEGYCGVADRAWIVRGSGASYRVVGPLFATVESAIQVALQVAHLDHDPPNIARNNLLALCPRCHLGYDSRRHAQTLLRRRRAELEAAGQLYFATLLDGPHV